jgi:hypothetical protein
VFFVAAAVAAPTADTADATESFRYLAVISVDEEARAFGGVATDWRETLELRMPVTTYDVRNVRQHRATSAVHRHALERLLRRVGIFSEFESLPEEQVDGPEVTSVAVDDGVGVVNVDMRRRWATEADQRGPCWVLQPPSRRAEIPGTVELQLDGFDVESVRPFPTSDDGMGTLRWRIDDRWPSELRVCTARPSASLATAIKVRAGYWRLLYPPADFLPLMLVFLAAAIALRLGRRRHIDESIAMDVRSVVACALGLTILIWIAWWARIPAQIVADHAQRAETRDEMDSWWDLHWTLHELGDLLMLLTSFVAALLLGLLAVRLRRRSGSLTWALGVVLVLAGTLLGLVAVDMAGFEPLRVRRLGEGDAWYHEPVTVGMAVLLLVLFVAVFAYGAGALVALAARVSPRLLGRLGEHERLVAGAAATLGALVGGYWLIGTYVAWNRGSHREGFARELLAYSAPYAGTALVTATLYAFPIVLFVALLGLLRAGPAASRTFGADRTWVGLTIALIFSAYVVGRQGWIDEIGLPLPVASAVAFAAVFWLARRDPATATHEDVLGRGPYPSWWANGVTAARLGVPLAVLPFLFYAYLLLDAELGDALAMAPSPRLPYLLTWLVNEAIFWLAAALVLGFLLEQIRLPNAVFKGLVLAGVYAASVGLGQLLVSGVDEHWTFRALVLVLFYIGLGIRLDLAALRAQEQGWSELVAAYDLASWRGAVRYASPALLALVAIAQQLYAGDVQQAGSDLVSNLTTFIPDLGSEK